MSRSMSIRSIGMPTAKTASPLQDADVTPGTNALQGRRVQTLLLQSE